MIHREVHRARSAAGHAHDVDASANIGADHRGEVVAHVFG